MAQDQLWVQEDNGRVMSQAAPQLFDLSSLRGSFCADVVVLPVLTGLLSLLEDPLLGMENCGTELALTFSVLIKCDKRILFLV